MTSLLSSVQTDTLSLCFEYNHTAPFLVSGRIHTNLREKNQDSFAYNKERIFCVFLPQVPTDMDASFLWFCFSAQVMWKTHSYFFLLWGTNIHKCTFIIKIMKGGQAVHLQKVSVSDSFKTCIILSHMQMLIFLSSSGNKDGSHPAKYIEWERILV